MANVSKWHFTENVIKRGKFIRINCCPPIDDRMTFTAISFAPVQGFIEKSRKLRDLFGASLILSYLTFRLLEQAKIALGDDCIISPGMPTVQQGMPNRILLKGHWLRDNVEKTLLSAWKEVLEKCKIAIETQFALPSTAYDWQSEWVRWGRYTWEVFWGQGDSPMEAMDNLEARKLKRAWTAINWVGESSSLTGTDAIAWPQMGGIEKDRDIGKSFNENRKASIKQFYRQLAWVLDDSGKRRKKLVSPDEKVEGKFLAENERLSVPELTKRLVTLPSLARWIGIEQLDRTFDIDREPGIWTGWFMGDGDKVGDYLRQLKTDVEISAFSEAMRNWDSDFKRDFPKDLGRVVYAGGDDFLGVIYNENLKSDVLANQALQWLLAFKSKWEKHQKPVSVSMGFVWAGHQVPQRDILQHCREAEQRSKAQGRNRVTIRVVFNSGQHVQWTCPWNYLEKFLCAYQDRDRKTWGQSPNWVHLYQDWMHLQARHAIQLTEVVDRADDEIALNLFDLYFGQRELLLNDTKTIVGDERSSPAAILEWLDGLVNVGWQLCSSI